METNKITKKEFLENVRHEVETIKNLATKKEINRLDFNSLDPDSKIDCIYGQMTGYCRSRRALKLISEGCIRMVKNPDDTLNGVTFNTAEKQIAGPFDKKFINDKFMVIDYFSSLETYILLKDSKTRNIIKYLKGEINTLKL